jgi:lipoate-protein ligase A
MTLDVLPTRTGGAAENMAVDYLLLQRYPRAKEARLRHYEWRAPAFTFGYSQKIDFVRTQIPVGETFDLCRRPTGGGIVDHREDWTYAIVIPRGHPLEELRATQSYRTIHEALADALRLQHVDVLLKPVSDDAEAAGLARGGEAVPQRSATEGVCFQRAEIYDVVHGRTSAKIAGAAQKRNKHGLLFQGSIWRPAVSATAFDWDRFEADFIARLAVALGTTAEPTPWPDFNEDEVSALTEQYSSTEWIDYR